MKKFDNVLVVSHIAYRDTHPFSSIEGPYSALCQILLKIVKNVSVFGVPLTAYKNDVVHGKWVKFNKTRIPQFLGKWLPLKFSIDVLLTFVYTTYWSIVNTSKNNLVIAIDPLSCLPLLLLKNIFGFKLVFHCVDFNRSRFGIRVLQRFYELADEWASKYSDQTWVICESLKDYKKNVYGVVSYYVPNSVVFDKSIYKNGKSERTGDKMVWTGSLLTERQFDILFRTLSLIQNKVRRDMKFIIAPTKDYDKFETYAKKYKLKNTKIVKLNGRYEFQILAAKCDVGIALYDERFGSTEFIEPMKIWDFLLCGLPFIVSCEPSVSSAIKKDGVAYFMKPGNKVPDTKSLSLFLSKQNLSSKADKCLKIAKKYDIEDHIRKRIDMLLLPM